MHRGSSLLRPMYLLGMCVAMRHCIMRRRSRFKLEGYTHIAPRQTARGRFAMAWGQSHYLRFECDVALPGALDMARRANTFTLDLALNDGSRSAE